MAYNIYVPTPTIKGVVFEGFYVGNTKIENNVYSNVTLDGVDGWWNRLVGLFESGDFTAKTITIKYTVNGQELVVKVNIDVFNYAYRVDSEFGCGSDESKLVYAMMQYKRSEFLEANPDSQPEFDEEWEKYMIFHDAVDGKCQKCENVAEYTAPTAAADDSAISALVKKYSYALVIGEDNKVSYAFSLCLNNEAVVKINGVTVTGVKNGDYTEYTLTGLKLADLANEMTIEIGGTSGKYSLANYVKANENEFTKALYVLAINAE